VALGWVSAQPNPTQPNAKHREGVVVISVWPNLANDPSEAFMFSAISAFFARRRNGKGRAGRSRAASCADPFQFN
jgi:hypothetical protein